MTEADIEALVSKLRSTTPLGRLGHDEARVVVETLIALGWKPAP